MFVTHLLRVVSTSLRLDEVPCAFCLVSVARCVVHMGADPAGTDPKPLMWFPSKTAMTFYLRDAW